ncbi:MAG: O-antigen ligase family protein [Gemmatimonadales bacterium]
MDTAAPVRANDAGRGWDLLILCVSAFILTSVARVHQLFPAVALLMPVTVSGVLALVLCVLDRVPAGRIGAQRIPATQYLFVLVAWLALSVPGALWPGGAFTTFVDFLKTALIFLVIVTAVRSVRDVERLTLVYFVGAVIFAIVVLSRTNFQLGVEGRMERLYFYDSNDFATYAVTALPLGLFFASTARRLLLRLAAWAGIGVLAVGFIWSGSRGGFLALLAVVAYFLLRYSTVRKSWRLSVVVAIGVVVLATAGDTYWTRISTVLRPSEDYNLTSDQGRLRIWRRGVGYMTQHPLLGVGAGNFPRAEGTISPLVGRQRSRGLKWGPPHNSYVQVGAELGVPGLLIFVAFLYSVFRALSTLPNTAGPSPPPGHGPFGAVRLAQSLTAALIGFAVGSFFLTLAYHDMLYTLAGIAVGLRQVTVNAYRAQRGRAAPSAEPAVGHLATAT